MKQQTVSYQPKGGMCAVCMHKHNKCDDLEFSYMPVLAIMDGTTNDVVKIVKCTRFEHDK